MSRSKLYRLLSGAVGAGLVVSASPSVGAAAAESDASRPARTIVLSPAQMFRLAELAQQKADLATAFTVYSALERNPDPEIRAEARFRHAKQLLGQKRNSDAALLLRRLVDEKPDATVARLELAHALELLGNADGALRAAKPFGASFEIALAPDSNINRATRSDTLGTIFGDFDVDQDSKAKSGTGLSLQGQAFRRIPLGASDQNLLVRLASSADLYRETEFNDIAVDLAAGPELRLGRNRINLELGATQRWYGQKPFMRSARLGATWTRPIGSRMQARFTGIAALVDNQFNDLQDGKSYSGEVELERALSSTSGVGLSLSANRQALKDPGYSTTGWRAGLLGWHDVGRMTFTVGLEYGKLHADERLQLFPDRRSDRYSRLSIGATFRQLQFRGFAPVARFSIERNRSTVGFYEYRRTRTEIGFVRAF